MHRFLMVITNQEVELVFFSLSVMPIITWNLINKKVATFTITYYTAVCMYVPRSYVPYFVGNDYTDSIYLFIFLYSILCFFSDFFLRINISCCWTLSFIWVIIVWALCRMRTSVIVRRNQICYVLCPDRALRVSGISGKIW